jgi:transcriptional regulator with XRE-family HTH domain
LNFPGARAVPDVRGADAPPAPPLRDVIGEVLREERTDQGRTLADVADAAHVSLPYLSEVERGRKEVSSDVLAAICDALELPLVDVLERGADRLRARAQGSHRFVLLAA